MLSSTLNTTCFMLHQQHLSWFSTVRHLNCQQQARKALRISNFIGYIFAKSYKNWFTNKKSYCKNKKGRPIVFLKHSVVYMDGIYCNTVFCSYTYTTLAHFLTPVIRYDFMRLVGFNGIFNISRVDCALSTMRIRT